MEVVCNLKKLANFFKFFLCILDKAHYSYIVRFSQEKNLDIFFPVL